MLKLLATRLSPELKACMKRSLILNVELVLTFDVKAATVPPVGEKGELEAELRSVKTASPFLIPLVVSVSTVFQSAVVMAVVDDLAIVAAGFPFTKGASLLTTILRASMVLMFRFHMSMVGTVPLPT